jgi:hypothetical protein
MVIFVYFFLIIMSFYEKMFFLLIVADLFKLIFNQKFNLKV